MTVHGYLPTPPIAVCAPILRGDGRPFDHLHYLGRDLCPIVTVKLKHQAKQMQVACESNSEQGEGGEYRKRPLVHPFCPAPFRSALVACKCCASCPNVVSLCKLQQV